MFTNASIPKVHLMWGSVAHYQVINKFNGIGYKTKKYWFEKGWNLRDTILTKNISKNYENELFPLSLIFQ